MESPSFQGAIPNDQNIYWLGEQHGTIKNYEVAYKYLKHLVDSVGIDYILIENSYLTEILLNKYLKTGNEGVLDKSISNYQNVYYANVELRNYLKKVYELNSSLPKNRQFTFVSIDIEQTFSASKEYVHQYMSNAGVQHDFESTEEVQRLKEEKNWLEYYGELEVYLDKHRIKNDSLRYMVANLEALLYTYKHGEEWDEIRDSLIYENFKARDDELEFAKKKSFAFWGNEHCYKSPNKKGTAWIASLIQKYRIDIKQSSSAILYKDCRFMRSKGMFPKVSRVLFQKIDENFICHGYQNEPFQGLSDVRHLEKNSMCCITLWKVEDLDPSWNFVTRKSSNGLSIDYIDNVIFLRDSECCSPYY